MEQIGLNGIIGAIFAGYKEAKDKNPNYDARFNEIAHTPWLFDSSELNELYENARSKEDHEIILDHMYRLRADAPTYDRLEKKIIDKYWEG